MPKRYRQSRAGRAEDSPDGAVGRKIAANAKQLAQSGDSAVLLGKSDGWERENGQNQFGAHEMP
jgi:hypothetical protein